MRLHKLAACLTALLLLTALPVFASDRQQVTLTEGANGAQVRVSSDDAVAASWEIPTLKVGERLAQPGTITLQNQTDGEATVTLDYVELPFDNADALVYLNHVTLTVRDGESVLYKGAYSRVNDEDGLAFRYVLAAGESVTLTVELGRDYVPLATTGFETDAVIEWHFVSVREQTVAPDGSVITTTRPTATTTATSATAAEPFDDPELAKAGWALLGAAALLALAWGVQCLRRR